MRLLLDTHVVLWWLDDPDRLSARARNAINSRETYVSAVTGCEIGQKSAVGKLRVPDDLVTADRQLTVYDVPVLPATE